MNICTCLDMGVTVGGWCVSVLEVSVWGNVCGVNGFVCVCVVYVWIGVAMCGWVG